MRASVFFALVSIIFIQQVSANERRLSFQTSDGITLSVMLYEAKEARAVAVILPGSGNVGLDGDVSSLYVGSGYLGQSPKLSEQMAAALAEVGVSSYRYAKRGFEQADEQLHQNFPYLLDDARAALGFVRQAMPGVPVFLVGHSEGALLATHLAARESVAALFLLSVPTRPIDSILEYQFSTWPKRVLVSMDHDGSQVLETSEYREMTTLPGSGGLPLSLLDLNRDSAISLRGEMEPFFVGFMQQVFTLIDSMPVMAAWRKAMQEIPAFTQVAEQVGEPVYVYHGSLDPQVPVEWSTPDVSVFPGMKGTRIFPGVGHAFSLFEGTYGEKKTSGPYSDDLLHAMKLDVQAFFGEN